MAMLVSHFSTDTAFFIAQAASGCISEAYILWGWI